MTSKITRLSPTDLANNAGLPTALKHSHLARIETPKVRWNLDPIRDNFPKLVRAAPTLALSLSDGDDQVLLSVIEKCCRRGDEQKATCLAISQALITWRTESGARGVFPDVPIAPYRSSVDVVNFAEPLVLVIDGQLYIVALDLRSSESLSIAGREIVKSVLWHTARIGSLKNAKIALLRTPSIGKAQRKVVFETLEGEPKYSADTLDHSFNETYSIWQLILMARRNASSDGSGMTGGLFD